MRPQNVDGTDVMRYLLATLVLCLGPDSVLSAQSNAGKPTASTTKSQVPSPTSSNSAQQPAGSKPAISPVRFGANGWPVLSPGTTPAPGPESQPNASNGLRGSGDGGGANNPSNRSKDVLVAEATKEQPMASGMQLDSPLHDVFRATRSPGALRTIGGVEVWWRVHIHGTSGEDIGIRTIKHTADCVYAERDRIHYTDSHDERTFARMGNNVSAQRKGLPWDSMTEAARAQLSLFGMHLRMPWCFGEGKSYAVMRQTVAERRGEVLTRLELQRRPPATEEVFGPEHNPKPRDRYELLFEPTTGLPRELVHRFASSGQQRRILLEDWKDVGGVRMPFRRIYVDEVGRATTTLEILKIKTKQRVTERDFRLL